MPASPAFEMRHVVTFEETNLVGNVYYANHVRWQGRCRELFLHAHAPELLGEVAHGLVLVTTRVACEYFDELYAFDEVIVRMRAGAIGQGRVTMHFEYWRRRDGAESLVAQGEQQIACLRCAEDGRHVPTGLPEVLVRALEPYRQL